MLKELTKLEFWRFTVLGNSLQNIGFAVLSLIILLFGLKLVQSIVLNRYEKKAVRTETPIDNAFISIVRSIKPPFYYFLAFYISIQFLKINPIFEKSIYLILISWAIYQASLVIQIIADVFVKKSMGVGREKEALGVISLLNIFLKIILWSIGLLFVLSNFGINITSLVAGLGIGGVAFALAMQNILKDLFSSFTIYFDRPFIVGDHIIVGNDEGVVRNIGVKSTRLKSVSGEELIISNQELTSARILNLSNVSKRRAKVILSIPFNTPIDKLEKILQEAKDVVEIDKHIILTRSHVVKIDGKNFVFEIVFDINTGDKNLFLDLQQQVLLNLKKLLEKEKIDLA
jgi:small-conductance mechanosensitive channel